MKNQYIIDYTKFSDRQIVGRILEIPHDEDAAYYLLHDRYAPLLLKLYLMLEKDDIWFDDCIDELFIHMKGTDGTWHILATFEWRSTFGYWLKGVAWNKFCEVLPKLIEKSGRKTSIDDRNPDKPELQLAGEDGEDTIIRRERKIMLMEAIGKLKDEEQRFVVLKRLEGYSSKEIAVLMQIKWQRLDIVKYNKKNEVVVPDEGYVNVHVQRAKQELKKIMSNKK